MEKQRLSGNQIAKNVMISVTVQGVSLLVSLISGFLIPKFIDEYQYACRELYLLYVGYVGLLHFGLLDGILLRYAQYDYEELDKTRLHSQLNILLGLLGVMAALAILFAVFFLDGVTRTLVILVAVGSVTRNIATYNSYLFQITNQIGKYATLILVQRIVFGAGLLLLLLTGVGNFVWYCVLDLLCEVLIIVIAFFLSRDLYTGRSLPLTEGWREWAVNVSSGSMLLLANWSSMLLLGLAKMMIEWHFGKLAFGQAAFAFNVANMFLTFISAVSVVLFPSLKRMDTERLPKLYQTIRGMLSVIMCLMLLLYFPGRRILELFLPKYALGLAYLGTLLPMLLYSSKVNLLTNNYLKAYRKERLMLLVNVVSIAVAAVLFAVCVYAVDSLQATLIAVVAAVMLNSLLPEWAVAKTVGIRFVKDFFAELLLGVLFIVLTNGCTLWCGFALWAVVTACYLIYERHAILPIVQQIKTKIRRN